MRSYHAKSYSQQARKMANDLFNIVTNPYPWEDITEQDAIDILINSYRHPLVRQRAAGIFGRKMREYKKRKNLQF